MSGRNELPKHFIGAAIVEQQTSSPGQALAYNVIDGQQRLVTLAVLLAAVRDAIAQDAGQTISAQHGLFWVRDEDGNVLGKRLEVQDADKEALRHAMEGDWRAWYGSAKHAKYLNRTMILHAYTYFRYCIWNGTSSFEDSQDSYRLPLFRASTADAEAESLWDMTAGTGRAVSQPIDLKVLDGVIRDRLFILNLTLEDGDEDGPTIFDTMNAKRTQLEQWDFIRNSLFIRLPTATREQLFSQIWAPAQQDLVQATYAGLRAQSRDAFVYDYLIARGEAKDQGTINRNRGHDQLMRRVNRIVGSPGGPPSIEDYVRDDLIPASRAWCCAVGHRNTVDGVHGSRIPDAAIVSRDSLMALSSGPPVPVMLHFLDGWGRQLVSEGDLIRALQLLESYVARHVLCQTPMSPFRAHFMQMMTELRGSYRVTQLKAQLKGNWKTDADVRNALDSQPVYEVVKAGQLGALFRGLELEMGGPGANPIKFGKGDTDYSVEHVYPKSGGQGPNAVWRHEFTTWRVSRADEEWIAAHRNFIGNLTVITNVANRKLHAKAFAKKLEAYKGRDPENLIPPLAVNKDIQRSSRWTKKQMQDRTKLLADAAIARWKLT